MKEYQLVGGQPVKISPLEVTENGTTYAPNGCAFNPVTVNLQNPNSIEIYTGTLDDPWGDLDLDGLLAQVNSGDVTMRMEIDGSELGLGTGNVFCSPFFDDSFNFQGTGLFGSTVAAWYSAVASYTDEGVFNEAYLLSDGTATDITEYASSITTTLTVMRHPMPAQD